MRYVIAIPTRRLEGDIHVCVGVTLTGTNCVEYHFGETASVAVDWILAYEGESIVLSVRIDNELGELAPWQTREMRRM